MWTDLTLLSLSPANWLMTLKSSSNHPALFLTCMFVLFSNSGRNEHLCHLLTWVWIWKYVCKILCMICCLMYDIHEEETIQNYLLLVRLGVSVCFDSGSFPGCFPHRMRAGGDVDAKICIPLKCQYQLSNSFLQRPPLPTYTLSHTSKTRKITLT